MPFTLTEDHLAALFELANLDTPDNQLIFFGLRGCVPLDDSGTPFASQHQLEFARVDYTHMNCTIGQWRPGSGFAVFPGSTVPYIERIKRKISAGGAGVNQLALGFYSGNHSYYRGIHQVNDPNLRHRAFRNDSSLPVQRTADDADYDADDTLYYQVVYDNIHCARQLNTSAAQYSSNGCQVIAGRPQTPAKGWNEELGPWKKFVENAYKLEQSRFSYGLFSGFEALKIAELGPANRAQTVRFGSSGPLVTAVQEALLHHQYDLGPAGADGDCGFTTVNAIRRFQLKHLGRESVDMIVGPATAEALGIAWPKYGEPPVAFVPKTESAIEEKPASAATTTAAAKLASKLSGPPKKSTKYAELADEYDTLFELCKPSSGKLADIDAAITALVKNQTRYHAVADDFPGMPWYFVAVVHQLEASRKFDTHLHNGDPLTARTVHVPPGRPASGNPPFSWEESARDALRLKKLHNIQDWAMSRILWCLEAYNGWGYRLYKPILTPYLWSFSNHYTKGKYGADGKYDPNLVSKQIGAATLLKRMSETGQL
ncbi:MAG: peptidoglycan-binding protein [Rhizobiales bacterium]|nr:peptidoglycan-binding protein [Hyphomicrobiales bacterium]